MADVLAQIVADKRLEVADRRTREPIEELARKARDRDRPRDFFAAVTRPVGELRVIAEVKKASPSAGLIRPDFDPVTLARAYESAGAAAISCLTDEKYFHGRLGYLSLIKDAVRLPVLRKDFMIDPWQVWEARAYGADAILLIAECLEIDPLVDMLALATELEMTTLVEVHDAENLLKVRPHLNLVPSGRTLLGINNRNLKSMTTDLSHTIRLLDRVDHPEVLVSESGIRTHADVERLRAAGVHRILVGEHLMRQPDVAEALRNLIHGPAA